MIKKNYKFLTLQDTQNWAYNFSSKLKKFDIVAIKGNLGVGKTVLARSIIQYFCGVDTLVPSPTFTMLQIYDVSNFSIWHFDLYKLNSIFQIEELGINDAFNQGISIIEWPEVILNILPKNTYILNMKLDLDSEIRYLEITRSNNII